MINANILFDRWFVQPLGNLQSIPNGDGGFIALATSCFLYERYAIARLKVLGLKADDKQKIKMFVIDFSTDKSSADAFWNVIRNGILHQGMPKQKEYGKPLPGYILHHSFIEPVKLTNVNGESILMIQPWLFMNRVIELWQDNLELIEKNESFPWANIL